MAFVESFPPPPIADVSLDEDKQLCKCIDYETFLIFYA
jgi:hypothetical protein